MVVNVDGAEEGFLVFENMRNPNAFTKNGISLIRNLKGHIISAFIKSRILEDLEKTLHELKEAQTRLVQSEKLASLGQLTAGIAHEIQNPLNFVNNFSEVSIDLAEEISDLMFTYDDIVMITDPGIQRLLQEVDENDLLMALKASTEKIKTKILKNMSERRRQTILSDLEGLPPARLKDVLAAQKRILAVAKELSQSGKIEIIREPGQEVYI